MDDTRRERHLHIHNGDATADKMRDAGFPGEHFAFREALASGPTPFSLSKEEWVTTRAEFLAGASDRRSDEVRKDLERMYAKLDATSTYEEIILWFEHDLFCQVNLVHLLSRLSSQELGDARLSLICIGQFPGVEDFRGLGQLTAEQMASLFGDRHEVTDAEKSLAQNAWGAYCSPDPRSIESLLGKNTEALPFLRGAFDQHLARFPSVRNGLGHAENVLLELISVGLKDFNSLCPTFFSAEPDYGLGDAQAWRDLRRMSEGSRPAITMDTSDPSKFEPTSKASFAITSFGSELLQGAGDFVTANGIDLWLGGAHLHNATLWRWDEQERKLVAATAS